jgi:hypothetical protein
MTLYLLLQVFFVFFPINPCERSGLTHNFVPLLCVGSVQINLNNFYTSFAVGFGASLTWENGESLYFTTTKFDNVDEKRI